MASRSDFGSNAASGSSGGSDSSAGNPNDPPSVSEALAVLRKAASGPRAQSAIKTLENELGASSSSKPSSTRKAPGAGNSPFEQRMAARRGQGPATARKGAA